MTPTAANLIGTSAGLKGGYWATLADLLYGTMLPSGNDAAYSLAEYIGYFLCLHSEKGITEKEIVDLSEESTGTYVGEFIRVMNEKAYKL